MIEYFKVYEDHIKLKRVFDLDKINKLSLELNEFKSRCSRKDQCVLIQKLNLLLDNHKINKKKVINDEGFYLRVIYLDIKFEEGRVYLVKLLANDSQH